MSRIDRGRPGRVASLLVLAVALGIGVAAMEVGLRLALNPSDFMQATLVKDPVLGQRIEPGASGHDALGYRNASVPAKARVVAIGDSHTYGVSAPRDKSWPQQLRDRLGEPVYNLGLGGFGPLQYLHLARTTARDFEPKVVVVGFYFGNDLMDAYIMAHALPHWHAWRRSEGLPPAVAGEPGMTGDPPKRFAALRDGLSRHSMLYSVLRATVAQVLAGSGRQQAGQVPSTDARWAWSDPAAPAVRTTFKPLGRLHTLDLARPAVVEGLQITQQALTETAAEVSRQGARLLVVLIPTKERAYCNHLKTIGSAMPAAHARLCDAEALVKARLIQHLVQQRIEHVDATPALEARIASHTQLYPPDDDGHELAAGYGVIAGAVAEALARPVPSP